MGGPSIMAVDGISSAHWKQLEDSMLISCQIETPKGVELVEKIASCDFMDLVMTGPYDLAHNMGLVDDYLGQAHLDVLLEIKDRCHNCGKPIGMVVGSGREAKRFFDFGFDLIIMGECTGLFERGLAECMEELRG